MYISIGKETYTDRFTIIPNSHVSQITKLIIRQLYLSEAILLTFWRMFILIL